jgi:hypothetical protein
LSKVKLLTTSLLFLNELSLGDLDAVAGLASVYEKSAECIMLTTAPRIMPQKYGHGLQDGKLCKLRLAERPSHVVPPQT